MSQLALYFPADISLRSEDFLLSPANRAAYGLVMEPWPASAFVLYGPQGSGKTHLAHIWAARYNAVFLPPEKIGSVSSPVLLGEHKMAVIDSVEGVVSEEGLFHLLNHMAQHGGRLLMTASQAPARLPFRLPDLRSRLSAATAAAIQPPDDVLLAGVLAKAFADRQLRAKPEVMRYLLTRTERSFAAVAHMAQRIDEAALATRRNLTLPFVRTIVS